MKRIQITIALACLTFLVSAKSLARLQRKKRIVGGKVAELEDWPFMVHLSFHQENPEWKICGGSLIAKNFVLTAAHCLQDIFDKPEYVTVGVKRVKPSSGARINKNFTVSDIIIHPKYVLPHQRKPLSNFSFDYDIAILKLSARIDNNITLVKLPEKDEDVYSYQNPKCTVAGWGATVQFKKAHHFRHQIYNVSNTLMQAEFPLYNKSHCIKEENLTSTYKWQKLERLICAGHTGSRSDKVTCYGDSGSPFVCQNNNGVKVLQGVFITGTYHCQPGLTHIYASEVSKYIPWIIQILKQVQ